MVYMKRVRFSKSSPDENRSERDTWEELQQFSLVSKTTTTWPTHYPVNIRLSPLWKRENSVDRGLPIYRRSHARNKLRGFMWMKCEDVHLSIIHLINLPSLAPLFSQSRLFVVFMLNAIKSGDYRAKR